MEVALVRGNWRLIFGVMERQQLMNEYGQRAMVHWSRWLPSRLAAIEDPKSFFTSLGEQAAERVRVLSEEMEASQAPDLARLEYLQRVGRLNAIRTSAQEQVLSEMILLEPEPQAQDQSPVGIWDPTDVFVDSQGMPRDRSHPLWAMVEDETSSEDFRAALRQWHQQVLADVSSSSTGTPSGT